MVQALSVARSAAWRAATSAHCWAGARWGGTRQGFQALCRLSGAWSGDPAPSPVSTTHPGALTQLFRSLRGPSEQPPDLAGCHHLPVPPTPAQHTRPGFPTQPSGVALSIQVQAPPGPGRPGFCSPAPLCHQAPITHLGSTKAHCGLWTRTPILLPGAQTPSPGCNQALMAFTHHSWGPRCPRLPG